MTVTDWAVILAAAAAVIWVNWYFFIADRGAVKSAASVGGVQEVSITVHGGYEPRTVRIRAGVPARLLFDRQETSGCSEEVVFPDFGIRKFLPAYETTPVEIRAAAPGTYGFTCGMSMLHGTLVVE